MRELIHEFLKSDNNKEYVLKRLHNSIDFKSAINGQHTKSLEIIYYESGNKGFSGFDDKFELVARQGMSNMHYLLVTKDKIDNIGFTSKEYEKALLVFDDIEKELKRNEIITQLLD